MSGVMILETIYPINIHQIPTKAGVHAALKSEGV